MLTQEQLAEFNRLDQLIQEWVKKFGLDFYPQEFDVIPSEKMAELMAYFLPADFGHWSRGRDFEIVKTAWRLNRSNLPMEVVYNTTPPEAIFAPPIRLSLWSLLWPTSTAITISSKTTSGSLKAGRISLDSWLTRPGDSKSMKTNTERRRWSKP